MFVVAALVNYFGCLASAAAAAASVYVDSAAPCCTLLPPLFLLSLYSQQLYVRSCCPG